MSSPQTGFFTRIGFGLLAFGALSTAVHGAPNTPQIGARSLSKVCATKVPVPIEEASADYLFAITTMRGDAKILCGLWQVIKSQEENSILVWRAIAGAVLLDTMAAQSTISPYRAVVSAAIQQDPKRTMKSVPLAMQSVYANVRENAALGGGWTPRDLAYELQDRVPGIAATLQKAFDKWEPPD